MSLDTIDIVDLVNLSDYRNIKRCIYYSKCKVYYYNISLITFISIYKINRQVAGRHFIKKY